MTAARGLLLLLAADLSAAATTAQADPAPPAAPANQPGPGAPARQRPAARQPAGQDPAGQDPTGQVPTGQVPAGQRQAGQDPVGRDPAAQPPTAVPETAPAPGQPDPGAAAMVDFRTPDGTRVVLVPTAGPPLIHWAVATPTGPQVDPPAAPGLAAACALASLRGTWTVGSADADAERAALAALDAAEVDLERAPRVDGEPPADLVARVAELRRAADALCDRAAFRRVLAAAPAQDVAVELDGQVAVLTLTTAPFAVRTVAEILRERREAQALRGYRGDYAAVHERETAAWDRDDLAPLRAEAMALAYPGSALARAGDRPTASGVSRALAETAWAASQHPSRTVHVLTGSFDVAAAQQALNAEFAQTALPAQPALERATLRAQAAMRRSVVPGARFPAVVVAFPLRGDEDPALVRILAEWFAGGAESQLGNALQQAGRKRPHVVGRGPWPRAAAAGMFVVEVADPEGAGAGLADQVLALCADAANRAPGGPALARAHSEVLAAFHAAAQQPAELARRLAALLLERPDARPPIAPPSKVDGRALGELLRRILDGTPIVVEWRST